MDKVLLVKNILDALIFVGSSIIGAILYGFIDKKYSLTEKIFDPFKINYKWEWILHLVLAVLVIMTINYFGIYVFKISWFIVIALTGFVTGICIYNSNRKSL
ncbi:hypothetical protein [Clostridium sp. B9]|uniref:hypothetical protein n=1 Tax=Clostridium sp. B9 TaxID=3423224 RepID=UPI003D2EF976